jgi:hypothetical protein
LPDVFTAESTIREVSAKLGERGRKLLRGHGYEVGEGFVDHLSQHQSLEHAARADRIRDLPGLLAELNSPG